MSKDLFKKYSDGIRRINNSLHSVFGEGAKKEKSIMEKLIREVSELKQQNEELAVAYNNARKEIAILKNKVNNKNEV